jgi:hypothetical protein
VEDNPGEMGGRVASPTFVGRVEELQVLEAARKRAADAEPAIVLVGGEAGVGKTRLVAELTGGCATDETRVLAGGCVPVGDGALPYAPIVEVLRTLVAEVGVDEVRRLIGPSWPELARLLPALGTPDRAGQPALAALSRWGSGWGWPECGQLGAITLAAPTWHSAILAARLAASMVSTRSNALYDRCATELGVPEVGPMASKRAGQRGMRLLKGSDSG